MVEEKEELPKTRLGLLLIGTGGPSPAHLHMGHSWASKMTQQVKVLIAKPDDLSCSPRTHVMEGERISP